VQSGALVGHTLDHHCYEDESKMSCKNIHVLLCRRASVRDDLSDMDHQQPKEKRE